MRMAEGTNGLRFSASMSKSDYEALESDPSFEEIEYGMIICPYDYIEKYGPINEENVFGENPVYTDKDDGSGVRIMRLYSDTLVKRDENTVSFNGAIVNVLKENYLREFYGAGYIAARRGGVTHYKFAVPNDNARSVVYVAPARDRKGLHRRTARRAVRLCGRSARRALRIYGEPLFRRRKRFPQGNGTG